jgi:hypothetical protein
VVEEELKQKFNFLIIVPLLLKSIGSSFGIAIFIDEQPVFDPK